MKGYKTNARIRLGDDFYEAGHEFFGEAIHPNIHASIEMNQGIFTEIEVPDVEEEGNVEEIEAEGKLDEASVAETTSKINKIKKSNKK